MSCTVCIVPLYFDFWVESTLLQRSCANEAIFPFRISNCDFPKNELFTNGSDSDIPTYHLLTPVARRIIIAGPFTLFVYIKLILEYARYYQYSNRLGLRYAAKHINYWDNWLTCTRICMWKTEMVRVNMRDALINQRMGQTTSILWLT